MHRGEKNEAELYRFLLAIKSIDEIKGYLEKGENPTSIIPYFYFKRGREVREETHHWEFNWLAVPRIPAHGVRAPYLAHLI